MTENWIEVRCIACKQLGYTEYSDYGLLLFKVKGIINHSIESPVFIQVRCWHCKSYISWEYGTPNLKIDLLGVPLSVRKKNSRKRQLVAFE